MNDLFGQPVKPATKPVAGTFHTERRTQKTMLSGLDCLPGQKDLFDVDGAAPAPRVAFPDLATLPDGRMFPVYHGEILSWSFGTTAADEAEGSPRVRTVIRAMAKYRPEQLARERCEMLRASFNRMFGHNAKKVLDLIDDEMAKLA